MNQWYDDVSLDQNGTLVMKVHNFTWK